MKRKYNVLILIILFSFFFFRSAAAFSFPDFSKIFSEIKVKILKTKKEEQFALKKNALLEAVNLSIDNYQEQIKILKERCPIEEGSLEKGNLFSQIIKRHLIEKNRPLILTDEENFASTTKKIFSSFSLEEKQEILFQEAVCQQLAFSLEVKNKLENLKQEIEEAESLTGIGKKAKEFDALKEAKRPGTILSQEAVSIIQSEKNINTAIERVKKISLDLYNLKKENFQIIDILERLFFLAQKDAELSLLQSRMAKIFFVYYYPFNEKDRTSVNLVKKAIELQVKSNNQISLSDPRVLIEESQKNLNSAYQTLLLMSKLVILESSD